MLATIIINWLCEDLIFLNTFVDTIVTLISDALTVLIIFVLGSGLNEDLEEFNEIFSDYVYDKNAVIVLNFLFVSICVLVMFD